MQDAVVQDPQLGRIVRMMGEVPKVYSVPPTLLPNWPWSSISVTDDIESTIQSMCT